MRNNTISIPEVEHDDPELQNVLRYFSRHLVSLSGRYQFEDTLGEHKSNPNYFGYSGFIISIRGLWLFITAGHILKRIDEALSASNLKIFECQLIDSFGPDKISDFPIPFDYQRAPKYYIFDEKLGLDFGLIGLGSYYQQLLEKNNIVPVEELNWIHHHRVEFEYFYVLGLPEEYIEVERIKVSNKQKAFLTLSPTLIRINPAEYPPDSAVKTEFPRFSGKFETDIPLESLRGMSGGPILGFRKGEEVSCVTGLLRFKVLK